jgi:hypothetical protein
MNYVNDKDVFMEVEITLIDFASHMSIGQKHVVMWNLEDKDPSNVRNFVPAYLVKISNSVFEIVDDKDNICFASVAMDGDNGLINLGGTVIKFPSDDFLEFCKDQCLFYDGSNKRINGVDHKVTPNRQ